MVLPQPGLNRRSSPNVKGLKTEAAVILDIIDKANGDYTKYADKSGNPLIIEIGRGQLQYTLTPKLVWPSSNVLNEAINDEMDFFGQTEAAVILDIIDKGHNDHSKYVDSAGNELITEISRGQLQYKLKPEIVWPNSNTLNKAIKDGLDKIRIQEEKDRAEAIANAVGSAVVILPTDMVSKTIMLVIAFGTIAVAYTTKLENKFINALFYSAIIATSFYIVVKMSNAVEKAKGGINQMVITP